MRNVLIQHAIHWYIVGLLMGAGLVLIGSGFGLINDIHL